jgi:hypothetical protein
VSGNIPSIQPWHAACYSSNWMKVPNQKKSHSHCAVEQAATVVHLGQVPTLVVACRWFGESGTQADWETTRPFRRSRHIASSRHADGAATSYAGGAATPAKARPEVLLQHPHRPLAAAPAAATRFHRHIPTTKRTHSVRKRRVFRWFAKVRRLR